LVQNERQDRKNENIIIKKRKNSVEGEPVTDSFSDVSNYGVMAQVVARGKWAK